MGSAASGFFGREEPLETLQQAAAHARAGACATLLIEGEAGIGKTRLLKEALSRFRDPKDLVALGHGVELAGGELPYGAGSDALRSLVRDAGAGAVRAAAGPDADTLAAICPALGVASTDVDRTRLLPAFAATVEALAADRLVWLIVEDLHWADASSRDLFSYLLRVVSSCRLLTLITVRTHDPAVDPAIDRLVSTLTALHGVDRLALPQLGPDDVAALVDDLAGRPAAASRVSDLVALGQGNPLLTEQLFAAGIDATSRIPKNVLSATLDRLRHFDVDTRRLLQTASVADGHISHRLLRQAFQEASDGTDGFEVALGRALDARLLTFDTREHSYSFRHALLREAVESSLRPDARIRAHRRWAELLSTPDHDNHPGLLIAAAHHWAEADADPEAFDAALAAARIARRLQATAELAPLLRRILSLWDRVPDPEGRAGATREDVLMEAMFAFGSIGNFRESRRMLGEELRRPDTAELEPVQVLNLRVAHATMGGYLGETGYRDAFDELLGHVPQLMEAAPMPSTIQLLWCAGFRMSSSDPEGSLLLCWRALDLSRQLGSETHYLGSIENITLHKCQRGHFTDVLELCRSEEAATDDDQRRLALRAQSIRALYCLGQFPQAVSIAESELARCDANLDPEAWLVAATSACESWVALGQWDRALAMLEDAGQYELDRRDMRAGWCLDLGLLVFDRGDTARAENLAAEARSLLPDGGQLPRGDRPWQTLAWDPLYLRVYLTLWRLEAELAGFRGDPDAGRSHLNGLLELSPAEMTVDFWPVARTAARLEGERAPAAARDTSIVAVEEAVEHLPRDGPFCTAQYLHATAELARARGTDDVSRWRDVSEAWRSVGHVHHLGWSLLSLSACMARNGERGQAEEPLTEAGQIAEQLGALPLRDAVVRLGSRSRIPTGISKPRDAYTGRLARLSPRELEVLTLLIDGFSNDELAAALFISPKTASVHVSRILAKLDVSTRAKAVAFAYEQGLIGSADRG